MSDGFSGVYAADGEICVFMSGPFVEQLVIIVDVMSVQLAQN